MTHLQKWERYARRRLERMDRMRGQYAVVSRGRHSAADLDAGQLYASDSVQLRILAEGNGATTDDIGKFWFTPGFSRVGGPDIIPDGPL